MSQLAESLQHCKGGSGEEQELSAEIRGLKDRVAETLRTRKNYQVIRNRNPI
jgi:hypothetical protein